MDKYHYSFAGQISLRRMICFFTSYKYFIAGSTPYALIVCIIINFIIVSQIINMSYLKNSFSAKFCTFAIILLKELSLNIRGRKLIFVSEIQRVIGIIIEILHDREFWNCLFQNPHCRFRISEILKKSTTSIDDFLKSSNVRVR